MDCPICLSALSPGAPCPECGYDYTSDRMAYPTLVCPKETIPSPDARRRSYMYELRQKLQALEERTAQLEGRISALEQHAKKTEAVSDSGALLNAMTRSIQSELVQVLELRARKLESESKRRMACPHPQSGVLSIRQRSLTRLWSLPVNRSEVVSVSFEFPPERLPTNCVDLSAAQDGSVLGWAERKRGNSPDNNSYTTGLGVEVHIASTKTIRPDGNCAWMFARCVNLRQVRFNGMFDTSHVTQFTGMFFMCCNLKKIDLDTLRLEHATDSNQMFAGCYSLSREILFAAQRMLPRWDHTTFTGTVLNPK